MIPTEHQEQAAFVRWFRTKPKGEVPVAILQAVLAYLPEEGRLIWRTRPREAFASDAAHATWNARYAGRQVACVRHPSGALYFTFQRRSMKVHRVAWAIATGAHPTSLIDHKDGNPSNNRLDNLRLATSAQNAWNTRIPANKSGFRGVSFCKQTGRWVAQIRLRGKQTKIGRYDTPEEAAHAYDRAVVAQRDLEFAHTNFPRGAS